MLKTYHKLQPMPKTTDDLKVVLQTTCEELSQEHINMALANFTLIAYMAVATRGRQYNSINLQSQKVGISKSDSIFRTAN